MPVKGIRYYVRRPHYTLGLTVKSISKLVVYDVSAETASVAEGDGLALWLTGKVIKPTDPLPPGPVCIAGNTMLSFQLTQKLDGEPLLYEVRQPPWYSTIPHVFSDTNLDLTLDTQGGLASLSAGETDKTLEFIQAVAGLAVSAAKAAKAARAPSYCVEIRDTKAYPTDGKYDAASDPFRKYVEDHRRFEGSLDADRRAEIVLEKSLLTADAKKVSETLAALKSLRDDEDRVTAQLKNLQYQIPEDYYQMQLFSAGKMIPLHSVAVDKTPWVVITLKEVKRSPIPSDSGVKEVKPADGGATTTPAGGTK